MVALYIWFSILKKKNKQKFQGTIKSEIYFAQLSQLLSFSIAVISETRFHNVAWTGWPQHREFAFYLFKTGKVQGIFFVTRKIIDILSKYFDYINLCLKRACFCICRRWLLGIIEYGIVRRRSVYDDSVVAYAYCDTLLWQILYLHLWVDTGYFTGLVVLSIRLTS